MPMKILFALLLLPTLALAQDRTVDMTTVIHDAEGKPVTDSLAATPEDTQCKTCPPLTIGRAVAHALTWSAPGDERISAEQKFSRGLMAERLRDNKAVTLDASDTAAIIRLVGRLYGPPIVLPVVQAVDPNAKGEKLQ